MSPAKTGFNKSPDKRSEHRVAAAWTGLVTGADDDDPSGIATYSQAGAQFGYGLLWTVFPTTPFMIGCRRVLQHRRRRHGGGTRARLYANRSHPNADLERRAQWHCSGSDHDGHDGGRYAPFGDGSFQRPAGTHVFRVGRHGADGRYCCCTVLVLIWLSSACIASNGPGFCTITLKPTLKFTFCLTYGMWINPQASRVSNFAQSLPRHGAVLAGEGDSPSP